MQKATTTISDNTADITVKEWISAFLKTAITNGFAAACWSQPDSQSWDLIVDPHPLTYSSGTFPLLHELPSGFVLSPFHTATSDTYYIQSRIHIRHDESAH